MITANVIGPRIDGTGAKDLIDAGEAVIPGDATLHFWISVSLTITDFVANGEAS